MNMKSKRVKEERGKRGYRMRKTRSDCRVGTFEKKNGLPPGTVKKPKTPSPSILWEENMDYKIVVTAEAEEDLNQFIQ